MVCIACTQLSNPIQNQRSGWYVVKVSCIGRIQRVGCSWCSSKTITFWELNAMSREMWLLMCPSNVCTREPLKHKTTCNGWGKRVDDSVGQPMTRGRSNRDWKDPCCPFMWTIEYRCGCFCFFLSLFSLFFFFLFFFSPFPLSPFSFAFCFLLSLVSLLYLSFFSLSPPSSLFCNCLHGRLWLVHVFRWRQSSFRCNHEWVRCLVFYISFVNNNACKPCFQWWLSAWAEQMCLCISGTLDASCLLSLIPFFPYTMHMGYWHVFW